MQTHYRCSENWSETLNVIGWSLSSIGGWKAWTESTCWLVWRLPAVSSSGKVSVNQHTAVVREPSPLIFTERTNWRRKFTGKTTIRSNKARFCLEVSRCLLPPIFQRRRTGAWGWRRRAAPAEVPNASEKPLAAESIDLGVVSKFKLERLKVSPTSHYILLQMKKKMEQLTKNIKIN